MYVKILQRNSRWQGERNCFDINCQNSPD